MEFCGTDLEIFFLKALLHLSALGGLFFMHLLTTGREKNPTQRFACACAFPDTNPAVQHWFILNLST